MIIMMMNDADFVIFVSFVLVLLIIIYECH